MKHKTKYKAPAHRSQSPTSHCKAVKPYSLFENAYSVAVEKSMQLGTFTYVRKGSGKSFSCFEIKHIISPIYLDDMATMKNDNMFFIV